MNSNGNSRPESGFTLLELVATLAILAILVSIALPAYQSYTLRLHRTEAVVALLDLASCQERIYVSTGRYNTNQCLTEGLEHYSITIQPADTDDSLLFTAWAEPIGHQSNDLCGSLGLNQTGLRQVSSADKTADECWNIR